MKQSMTVKQRNFCNKFFETGNAGEAYKHAYNCSPTSKINTIRRKGYELLQKDYITAYLDGLRADTAKLASITVMDLVEELEKARALSMKETMPKDAIAATMGKAKLLGLDKVLAVEDSCGSVNDILSVIAKGLPE